MTQLTKNEVRRFILDRLSTAISANGLPTAALGDDFDLLGTGVLDSLGVIELISAVEQRFQITVDFERMDTAELTVLGPFCHFVAENAVMNLPEK